MGNNSCKYLKKKKHFVFRLEHQVLWPTEFSFYPFFRYFFFFLLQPFSLDRNLITEAFNSSHGEISLLFLLYFDQMEGMRGLNVIYCPNIYIAMCLLILFNCLIQSVGKVTRYVRNGEGKGDFDLKWIEKAIDGLVEGICREIRAGLPNI